MSQATTRRIDKKFDEIDYQYEGSKLIGTFEQDGKKFRSFAYLNKHEFLNESTLKAVMSINDEFISWLEKNVLTLKEPTYICRTCEGTFPRSRYRLNDAGTRFLDCKSCYSKSESAKQTQKLKQKKMTALANKINGVTTDDS